MWVLGMRRQLFASWRHLTCCNLLVCWVVRALALNLIWILALKPVKCVGAWRRFPRLWLPHARYLLLWLRNHLPSGWKHGLNLTVLYRPVRLILVAYGRMLRFLNFTCRYLLHALGWSVIFIDAPIALTSGIEEALHAVKIDDTCLRRLLFLRSYLSILLVHCLIRTRAHLLLNLRLHWHTLVSKSLRGILDLRLQNFIYALSLRSKLGVIVLRATDRVHCDIRAHRHALVHLSSRRQTVSPFLLAVSLRV